MLTCNDVTARSSALVDGELPAGERLRIGVHLLICPYCRRFLRQLRNLRAAVRLRGEQRGNDSRSEPAFEEKLVQALLATPTPERKPPP